MTRDFAPLPGESATAYGTRVRMAGEVSMWRGKHPRFPEMKPAPALLALNAELDALAELDGWRPVCMGPEARSWTSGDPDERAQAAASCRKSGCRVMAACAAAGRKMTGGVWAGRDREKPPMTKPQQARVLRRRGWTYRRIAAELGVTHPTARQWAPDSERVRAAREQRERDMTAARAAALDLRAQGQSARAIAEQLGINRATVRSWISRAGHDR